MFIQMRERANERPSVTAGQLLVILAVPFVVGVLSVMGVAFLWLKVGVDPEYIAWLVIALPAASIPAMLWLTGRL